MKCPNCGKKMKKDVCKACGYDPSAKPETPAAPVMNPAMRVNYYTYDPANPNVVYPMSVSGQGQTNPAIVATAPMQTAAPAASTAPVSKKAAKKAAKAEKKAAKKAAKVEAKANSFSAVDAPVRKNVASRLFAIVLIGLIAATAAVLGYYVLVDVSYPGADIVPHYSQGSLLAIVLNMLSAEGSLFGILPAYPIGGNTGLVYTLAIYGFTLFVVLALIHAVFAIFSKAKAPRRVRRALFFLGAGALAYSVVFALVINRWSLDVAPLTNVIALAGYTFDMFSLVVGAACLVLSLAFLIFRKRK